ncbi:hypothetical protein N431DRAFT_434416 [Stipitochalara longipes BDJ]|nr:hypothetical protein N431DRAFT_434416 [Stipitochalara longipes BDJ]
MDEMAGRPKDKAIRRSNKPRPWDEASQGKREVRIWWGILTHQSGRFQDLFEEGLGIGGGRMTW